VFEAPLVNTFVTYGYGVDTPGTFIYPADFVKNKLNVPPLPLVINITETGVVAVKPFLTLLESLLTTFVFVRAGDGIVPLRSSLRGQNWVVDQQAAGK
jgi:hypothetical protein